MDTTTTTITTTTPLLSSKLSVLGFNFESVYSIGHSKLSNEVEGQLTQLAGNAEGWIESNELNDNERVVYWHRLSSNRSAGERCCPNEAKLKELSAQLVGKVIFTDVHPNAAVGVTVNCTLSPGSKNLRFAARNELTPATAFGYLHFLHHLGSVFVPCSFSLGIVSTLQFNPEAFHLLGPEFRIHIGVLYSWGMPTGCFATMAQLFHWETSEWRFLRGQVFKAELSRLEDIFEKIVTWGPHTSKIKVLSQFIDTRIITLSTDYIDKIVEHLESKVASLASAVKEVSFRFDYEGELPNLLKRKTAVVIDDEFEEEQLNSDGGISWRPARWWQVDGATRTGEPFRVQLKQCKGRNRVGKCDAIEEVVLRFPREGAATKSKKPKISSSPTTLLGKENARWSTTAILVKKSLQGGEGEKMQPIPANTNQAAIINFSPPAGPSQGSTTNCHQDALTPFLVPNAGGTSAGTAEGMRREIANLIATLKQNASNFRGEDKVEITSLCWGVEKVMAMSSSAPLEELRRLYKFAHERWSMVQRSHADGGSSAGSGNKAGEQVEKVVKLVGAQKRKSKR